MKTVFASYADFLDYAERVPAVRTRDSRAVASAGCKFYGSVSFAECMGYARNGWKAGRDEIAKHAASFAALIGDRIRKPSLTRAVAGFSPDVGAFLSGEPECMFARETIETDAPGKILRVVVNGTASAAISAENMTRRGAMICALVDALESAGYRCEISVAFYRFGAHRFVSGCTVPVKGAGEPVELDRLAFILAHPGALRRLAFSAWEQDHEYFAKNSSIHGTPCDVEDRGNLYFGRMFSGETPDAELIDWFKAQLAPLGIEFSDQ